MLADTGPLFAASDRSDQYHTRARRELELLRSEGKGIVVAYPTVLECYGLMQRSARPSEAQRWLEIAERLGRINPKGEDYERAFERVRRLPDQSVSLFDALVATLAERFSIPVWTFDFHFDVMQVSVWRANSEG